MQQLNDRLVVFYAVRSAITRATGGTSDHRAPASSKEQLTGGEVTLSWCTLGVQPPHRLLLLQYFLFQASTDGIWVVTQSEEKPGRPESKLISIFSTMRMIYMAMYIYPLCWYLTSKKKGFYK